MTLYKILLTVKNYPYGFSRSGEFWIIERKTLDQDDDLASIEDDSEIELDIESE